MNRGEEEVRPEIRKLKDYKPTSFMAKDSHYDKDAADFAVSFIESLCHTKGRWAGKPFVLIDWQERLVRDIFGVIKPNGYRQFNTAYVEIPKKQGKQLALDTIIPTYTGYSTMGEIQVGDTVFDSNGKPCLVVAKSAVDYSEAAYRITFKDGEIVDAGERHLWSGEYNCNGYEPAMMTTAQIAASHLKAHGHYPFRIPVAEAAIMPPRDLPVDPYLYGYLLGNGEAPKSFCDKEIPIEYLRSSVEQRFQLLRGLMDSDSCIVETKGQLCLTSTKKPLAASVSELLWSLGIKNEIASKESTTRVDWLMPCGAHESDPNTRKRYRYIDRIDPIPNPGMQCIQVDSPSHLYLVGRSFLPTHNSELAAAIALLMTCGDGEQRAEVYGCAADRQQASIVFATAIDMARMCPSLMKRVKILESTKRLVYLPTNSYYQVLSAEAYSKHGFNIHATIFDELHTQPDRRLFDVMTKGSGDARRQPLFFLITTAGTDTHSVCYEQHMKALDIIEGRKFDPTFYPVIYSAKETDEWTDPEVWKRANPSLGITVEMEKLEAACESAKQNPAEENSFKTLRLCIWTKQSVRWMPMVAWNACAFPIDEDELAGRVCYGGLDLSSTSDLTAFVLVFPPVNDDDERYSILPFFWLPEEQVPLRVRRDHVPYDLWERQGFLKTTEGNVVHYGFIEKTIEQLGERFSIREIAYDRWSATQVSQNLEGAGFTMIPFGQGFKSMSAPTNDLMRLTLGKKIAHGGHPVLSWNMDNVFVSTDPAGNIKPDKRKSTEKIDGVVALVMALDRAIKGGAGSRSGSVYDERGILFIQ